MMVETQLRYTVGAMHDRHTTELMLSIEAYQAFFEQYWKNFEELHKVQVLIVQKGAFAMADRPNDPMRPNTIPRGEFVSRAVIISVLK